MNTKINLCDTYLNDNTKCSPDFFEFDVENNNIINCSSYDERKLINISASYQVMNCEKPVYENKEIKV